MNEMSPELSQSVNALLVQQVACMVLSAAAFLYMGYTAMTHFAVRGPLPLAMKAVVMLTGLGFVAFILMRPTQDLGWFSLILYVIYFVLLRSAKARTESGQLDLIFVKETPTAVVRRGPYRLIRHPIYLSYIFYWLANAIATGHWAQWATLALMSGIYFVAAKREERVFLHSHLAEIYRDYRDRTWMFIPYVY